ncbi:ATP synthase F0 subunit B [Desulfovibrio sp.]|uniref:ATP synthase F0 subunit B n=1 Tax=Desulfovibrio sp. TaxID=885 RepID=UPI0023D437D4|nr:ATP synthase F0 subunit B [Desulfovibrio sp.]MDE7240539.1 ATP synthase F0 subunit B [Desulfovibrio sp.]
MLDLNITLLFQLANFFIALIVLNILLIRPVRDIIKKRNGLMDDMASEADAFNAEAAEKLNHYEAELARARQEAGLTREEGRQSGLSEQQNIVGEAQQSARQLLAENRSALRGQAEAALNELRNGISDFSAKVGDRLLGNA